MELYIRPVPGTLDSSCNSGLTLRETQTKSLPNRWSVEEGMVRMDGDVSR